MKSITFEQLPADIQNRLKAKHNSSFQRVIIHLESEKADTIGASGFTDGNQIHIAPWASGIHTPKGFKFLSNLLATIKTNTVANEAPEARLTAKTPAKAKTKAKTKASARAKPKAKEKAKTSPKSKIKQKPKPMIKAAVKTKSKGKDKRKN